MILLSLLLLYSRWVRHHPLPLSSRLILSVRLYLLHRWTLSTLLVPQLP